ncbi:MAG: GNAT family N-acetyltransferase, partial [Ignavibacteriaceae bacterium]|nr:GNAT family N-acetyltransferase [Ignavibacteriaceae bacterium]
INNRANEMNNEFLSTIKIMPATVKEIPFIVETIIAAEKSGTDIIGTCRFFDLSETEYSEMIVELLNDNSPGYDYALSSYLVAFDGDKPVGAFGAWLEGEDGVSSIILKINAFIALIEREKVIEIKNRLQQLGGQSFSRDEGALQFEFAYVIPEYTGKGILQQIMAQQVKRYKNTGKNFNKAQVILAKENLPAIKSYQRFGFKITETIMVDEKLAELFSYRERVLMECSEEMLVKYF